VRRSRLSACTAFRSVWKGFPSELKRLRTIELSEASSASKAWRRGVSDIMLGIVAVTPRGSFHTPRQGERKDWTGGTDPTRSHAARRVGQSGVYKLPAMRKKSRGERGLGSAAGRSLSLSPVLL